MTQCLVNVAALAVVAVGGLSASLASAIIIPTVPIGNPGNAPDTRIMSDGTAGYGSVAYAYNIGATEVTNAQYTAFLNSVAATDTHSLYNTNMAGSSGGITRSFGPGPYTYATVPGRGNYPVNYVSFWDSLRFANWLHNGQPTGAQNASTTEDGAYTLTPNGIAANTTSRNANWQWAVTSEDEWYKAAYHQPATQGGDGDDYWLYPTSSNSVPTPAEANFGNVVGDTVPVGSYAANFYGAFDMGGNVWEWNETILFGTTRALRGGSFLNPVFNAAADTRNAHQLPTIEHSGLFGFRVVQVPGPASVALLGLGGVMAARRRR
jgi:formylglycine-generating enzyme required for sulfatase activity